jgi:manganese transport protein
MILPSDPTSPSTSVDPASQDPGIGWRVSRERPSLPEVFRSVQIPRDLPNNWWGFARKLLAFSGPGYLVAVGYMDPGNWATDIAGGSQFNYALLSVVAFSSLLAIFLQFLALKIGVATGRDLAQACRDHFHPAVNFLLWIGQEIAIAACDLAEVIGSAIALNLLFGLPLVWGVCLTALDVFMVLFLQSKGFRYVEALVVTLIAVIAGSFLVQMFLSRPSMGEMALGLLPTRELLRNHEMLYEAIGILGATVMPHNLFLHSSIAQTRHYDLTPAGKKEAILFGTIDSTLALFFAFFINAAILIVAAATFYRSGHHDVAEIEDAYKLLNPLLGVGGASFLFAVALLASGQNSTLTGTMAGQIVMEGFLHLRLPPVLRRLLTRLVAIVPAVIVTVLMGEHGTAKLLILSQVILSMALPFAVVPLVMFTNDARKMGEFVNARWVRITGWVSAVIIIVLNVWLIWETFSGNAPA